MNAETLSIAAPFAVGALVLLVSLAQVRSLLDLLSEPSHRQYWAAAGLLLGCFLVGYVVATGLVLSEREALLVPMTAAFSLLGAVFALLVVTTGQMSIQALVRSRDELERREEEFQRLYEVTDVLNRILRHNLRNNMNVILGRSDMLGEAVDDDEHVEAIRAEANRLVEIGEKARAIHDTLDADLEAEIRPIGAFVAPAVERVRAEFPDADLTADVPEDVWVEAGPLLETAVENVLDNAVRHNDGRARVEVAATDEGDAVAVSVADDGPGIHPYEVEAIREHRETPLQHGSGLGLWLASWIAEQYGGEIDFADNDPHGTVVTLRVPRAEPPEPDVSAVDGGAGGESGSEPGVDGTAG